MEITEEWAKDVVDMVIGERILAPNDDTWTLIAKQHNVEEHRWARTAWYIFEHEYSGDLWAMPYDFAATEMQESGFVYSSPEVFRVKPIETIKYERQ